LALSRFSVCLSVRPSVPTEKLRSHWTDFHENCRFFENLPIKFKFYENVTSIMDTVHKDLCTFMIAFR
jgi:hypothetical protein